MIKYIIIALFLPTVLQAQKGWSGYNPGAFGQPVNGLAVKKALLLPTGCGVPSAIDFDTKYDIGLSARYYDSCGHQWYNWRPEFKDWQADAGGGGSFGFTPFTYSTSALNGSVLDLAIPRSFVSAPAYVTVSVDNDEAQDFTVSSDASGVYLHWPVTPYLPGVVVTFTITPLETSPTP